MNYFEVWLTLSFCFFLVESNLLHLIFKLILKWNIFKFGSQFRSILRGSPCGWRDGVSGHFYWHDGVIWTLKWHEGVIWKTTVIVKMEYLRRDFVILSFNFAKRDVKYKQKPRLLTLNSSFLFLIRINRKRVTLNSRFLFPIRLKRKYVYSSLIEDTK